MDVNWYGSDGREVSWDGNGDRTLICLLAAPGPDEDPDEISRDLLLLLNASEEPQIFTMPVVARGASWRLFVNTAGDTPLDVYPDLDGPRPPVTGEMTVSEKSLRCYVATQWGRKMSRRPARRSRKKARG
jgi:glycogen operon protein